MRSGWESGENEDAADRLLSTKKSVKYEETDGELYSKSIHMTKER